MSTIPEKLNGDTIDRLIDIYREDEEMLEVLEESLLSFAEYHSSVYTMETKLKFLSPQSMDREEYQNAVGKMDAYRSVCHEALLTAVSVLNRLAEKENLPAVYADEVRRERPYRRQIANAVFNYVETIIRERR